MRTAGIVLMIIGVLWGMFAFNISTSVTVPSSGYFLDSPREVHNLSLATQKQNHLLVAGALVVVGAILFGFGSLKREDDGGTLDSRQCPSCAETVKAEAKVCKHCGRELPPLHIAAPTLEPEDLVEGDNPDDKVEALTLAAARGDWAKVLSLCLTGMDVNQPNARGKTALELGLAKRDTAVVSILKQHGARSGSS